MWLDIGQVSSEPREAGSQSVGQVRLCRGTFVSERIDHDLKQPSGSAGPCIRRHLVLFGSSPDGATHDHPQQHHDGISVVLRQVLQWDPAARPDGGTVERALLSAADNCTGEGLRTWAREIVPPILRKRQSEARHDDLVSKTLPIEGGVSAAPPSLDQVPIDPKPGRLEAETFNDLAPPAAVRRNLSDDINAADLEQEGDTTVDQKVPSLPPKRPPARPPASPPRVPQQRPAAPPPPKSSGWGRTLLLLGVASLGGGLLGLVLFLLFLLVLWVAVF